MSANGHILVLGFDFKKPVFMHAITHVADLMNDNYAYEHTDVTELFQNYNIYIGNSADYTENI